MMEDGSLSTISGGNAEKLGTYSWHSSGFSLLRNLQTSFGAHQVSNLKDTISALHKG
jgi:hypothetical protein